MAYISPQTPESVEVGQMTPDAQFLTCWKEIARYLGKGVRTIQRWETTMQLPVHRPEGSHKKSSIFVSTEELDVWMHERMTIRPRLPADTSLSEDLSHLRDENAALRSRLEIAERRLRNVGAQEEMSS